MKEEIVTHPGIISKIEKGIAEVSIIVNSGCASCSIQGSCTQSESKEKVIEVAVSPSDQFSTGQTVVVEMKQSMGTWAVLLGYFFPFLVVFISLIIFVSVGLDEGLAAILSLSTLVPYYFFLYLGRNYLSQRFTYSIRLD